MLPEAFITRMKKLLGDEYADFERALDGPSVKGVRVNLIKTSKETFKSTFNGELSPISYIDTGFIPDMQSGLGQLPEHHAGMFYSQDPGAMATVCSASISEGEYVLDACAAPGGKSSHVAEIIGDTGFLLANEYVPKRAKIIVGNFERLGIKNAVVTSLDTAEIAKMFSAFFDTVICDAPCSGEGMFRKYDAALTEWSEDNVRECAERQITILSNCAKTVKPGGKLLYSTCTYSIEENEGVIDAFLDTHPDFYLVPVGDEIVSVTSDGIIPEGSCHTNIALTRRFYPHKSSGEGQYIAQLKRRDDIYEEPRILYKDSAKEISRAEAELVLKFLKENFKKAPDGRFIKQGDGIALANSKIPIPPYSVFMPGVMLGEIRGKIFFPHHQLFSAFGGNMKRVENLKKGDPRAIKYLTGEEIEAKEVSGSGYVAVCYEGAVLGGGKLSGGKIKNHYPKGLRLKK
ncbi:MAG: hypothetical protein J6Q85_00860 [Clostridia bacterium]|nr:hypothetical protein [Clostridia bacterium]